MEITRSGVDLSRERGKAAGTKRIIRRRENLPKVASMAHLVEYAADARIFPEGSDLDTIFWSYDDWREARERVFAARAAKLADSKIPLPKI